MTAAETTTAAYEPEYPWTIDIPDDTMEILDEVDEHTGAALTLDPRDLIGTLGATYGRGSGDGTPIDIWHGVVLRVWLPEDINVDEAREYLEGDTGKALLDRVAAGHAVRWDGSNHVGGLDEDGQAALDAIEAYLTECRLGDRHDNAGRWEASDWLNEGSGYTADRTAYVIQGTPDIRITAATTDEEIAAIADRLDEEARGEYTSLRGTYDYLKGRRDECETADDEE